MHRKADEWRRREVQHVLLALGVADGEEARRQNHDA